MNNFFCLRGFGWLLWLNKLKLSDPEKLLVSFSYKRILYNIICIKMQKNSWNPTVILVEVRWHLLRIYRRLCQDDDTTMGRVVCGLGTLMRDTRHYQGEKKKVWDWWPHKVPRQESRYNVGVTRQMNGVSKSEVSPEGLGFEGFLSNVWFSNGNRDIVRLDGLMGQGERRLRMVKVSHTIIDRCKRALSL